jgi:hypothetical protein
MVRGLQNKWAHRKTFRAIQRHYPMIANELRKPSKGHSHKYGSQNFHESQNSNKILTIHTLVNRVAPYLTMLKPKMDEFEPNKGKYWREICYIKAPSIKAVKEKTGKILK